MKDASSGYDKAKEEKEDALIKLVFDNLRNLLISVSVFVAGLSILWFRAKLSPFPIFNLVVGIIITSSAYGLFIWNVLHGVKKILRYKTSKKWVQLIVLQGYTFSSLWVFIISVIILLDQRHLYVNLNKLKTSDSTEQNISQQSIVQKNH